MVKLTTLQAIAITPLLTSAYSIGRFTPEQPARNDRFNPYAAQNNPATWNPYTQPPPVQQGGGWEQPRPQPYPQHYPQQGYRYEQPRPQPAPFAAAPVRYNPAVNNGRWSAAPAAPVTAPAVNPAAAPAPVAKDPAAVAHGVKALSQMYSNTPHAHGFRNVAYGTKKGVAGLRPVVAAAAPASAPSTKPEGTLYAASPEFQKLTQAQSLDLGVPDNVNGTQVFDSSVNAVRNINVYSGVTGAILIITGLIMVFLGHKLWKPIWFICGFYAGGVIGLVILSAIESRGTNLGPNRDLIYIILCIILGLMFGGMFLCLIKLAIFAVGGLLGFVVATAILAGITSGPIATSLGRGLFIAGMIILFAILVAVIERPILVLATAFVGAFAVLIGVDAFVQAGLARATSLLLRGGGLTVTDKILWIEIAAFLVLGAIGAVVQFVLGKKDHYSSRKAPGYAVVQPEHGKGGMQAVQR
ncbi:hypothetical protein HK097_001253 [Rhizophlyctis rosea]|uniref:Transmembrane protein 198 n=1 Tax=Rhizophlyctis rosea TaxID=64517 RepID=A0AAD5S6U8_9FUNG|nr:hypothetical protein HK097_001253 [Rhizophlyctis rosea]